MSEEKKEDKKRETKAGLMEKNAGSDEVDSTNSKSEENKGNTPKIGKKNAGNHNNEPLH